MHVRRILVAGLALGLAASLTISHVNTVAAGGPVLTDHGGRGPGPDGGGPGPGGGHDGEYGVYAAAAAQPAPFATAHATPAPAPATPLPTVAPAAPAPATLPAVAPPAASETIAVVGVGIVFGALVVAGFVARRRLLRGWEDGRLDPSAP